MIRSTFFGHFYAQHTYSLELLMMDIEVPEKYSAYHKCNKSFSDV